MSESRASKELEEMTTTASFILTIGQVRWINEETERIKALPDGPKGFNRSVLVRQILDRAMSASLEASAA
jgi:hypothetical protein